MPNLDIKLSQLVSDAKWWKTVGVHYINDPVRFISECIHINHPDHGTIPFKLYTYQSELIEIYGDQWRTSVSHSRQMGLSVLNAAYALWQALYTPHQNIGIAAPTLREAKMELDIIRKMIPYLPKQLLDTVSTNNTGEIAFDTGSRILPYRIDGMTFRSMTMSTVYLCRPSSCKTKDWTEFCENAIPMLTSGIGAQIIIYDAISDCVSLVSQYDFYHCKVFWHIHPDRDEEFKHRVLSQIGQDQWDAEYGD